MKSISTIKLYYSTGQLGDSKSETKSNLLIEIIDRQQLLAKKLSTPVTF